jgi:hypothetical protein
MELDEIVKLATDRVTSYAEVAYLIRRMAEKAAGHIRTTLPPHNPAEMTAEDYKVMTAGAVAPWEAIAKLAETAAVKTETVFSTLEFPRD